MVEGESIASRYLHGDGNVRLVRRNLVCAVCLASVMLRKCRGSSDANRLW